MQPGTLGLTVPIWPHDAHVCQPGNIDRPNSAVDPTSSSETGDGTLPRMNSVPQVTCRSRSRRPLWFFVGLGVAGLVLAVARLVGTGGVPDRWVAAGTAAPPKYA